MDELQLRFVGGGGFVEGPLTLRVYVERGRPMTTEAQEVTTVDELQLRFLEEEELLKDF